MIGRRPEHRAKTAARGYGSKWRTLRSAFLVRHPLCVECHKIGQMVAATQVDHIRPHKGAADLLWDWNNLQALCESCHSKKTRAEQLSQGGD